MPPKQKTSKAVEDKTFGMKNKNKSKKVQQYVQHLQQQASTSGSKEEQKARLAKEERARQKLLEEERKKEMAALFQQTVIQQKVPFGVDPKTVICAHFKVGQCTKGAKCKFSHDLNVGRKVEKKNVYQDSRDDDSTMENWDQAKLESAITEREKDRVNLNKATEIVCKFFLEAIESGKYGWFWDCPNGKDCKYRHALPPGFVLKKRETEEERREREAREKANQITIEDFLEKERHNLGPNTTPVTAASFAKWKLERTLKREALELTQRKAKQDAMSKMKQGLKNTGMVFSGRDMFEFNPDWAHAGDEDDDDGEDMDLDMYKNNNGDDDVVMTSLNGSVESLNVVE